LLRVTNLYKAVSYDHFLRSNQVTISLFTLINILLQIALTLRYLRNCEVIYFNLCPSKIKLKRGQLIKFYDFTNSNHLKLKIALDRKNILPYVIKRK
jgi:hypothetical protein